MASVGARAARAAVKAAAASDGAAPCRIDMAAADAEGGGRAK
jgi:hypothetical protein